MGIWSPPGGSGSVATALPDATLYPALHAALGRVMSGAGDSTILFVGDSIMSGLFTNNIGPGPCTQLVRMLAAALGIPVSDGLAIPVASNVAGPDNRWANGAGWSGGNASAPPIGSGLSWGGLTPNGIAYFGANAAAGSLTFQPRLGLPNVDTFDIYSIGGSFSCNFNFGGNTVVGSLSGLQKTTVTGASTARPFCIIQTPTGLGCVIIGVDARLSTAPTLRVGNAGVTSATTGGGTFGGWNNAIATGPLACITFYNPQVTVINLGVNDTQQAIPLSTSVANWTALANTAKACQGGTGGVIFTSQCPINPNVAGWANYAGYWAALKSFCAANGYGYIDLYNGLGGNAGFNVLSAMNPSYYGDGNSIHPGTNPGMPDYGRMLAAGLLSL